MPARKVRTTVVLSADLLEAMHAIVQAGVAESRNDFLERAIRRQLAATRRAGIDAEFAQMANDSAYQEEAIQIAEELKQADWEALRATERSA
jgi:metal-responsive CopG/Arc/MetJ family transcriptional regulator